MGQAIAGGLLTSTLITLILIPVIYYLSENKIRRSPKKARFI
jgi:HAE1 family hydrophobic/amphiphilic exporter-1